ncbi:DUF1660 family phage protein [Muricauda sp. MAR_2010_75]
MRILCYIFGHYWKRHDQKKHNRRKCMICGLKEYSHKAFPDNWFKVY